MTTTYVGSGLVPSRDPQEANTDAIKLAPGTYLKGTAIGQFSLLVAVNEVQTLTFTGTPTGGTFKLAFNGQVTSAITYSVTDATLQANILAALIALTNVGTGNVTVSSGTSGTVVTITFAGALAGINQPPISLFSNSLTGGSSPTATVAETTPGHAAGAYYGAYDDSLSNGLQICRCFLKFDTVVDEQGNHSYAGLGIQSSVQKTAVAYFAGTFYTATPAGALALPGLDAAGVVDVGRMIVGVSSSLTALGSELRMS